MAKEALQCDMPGTLFNVVRELVKAEPSLRELAEDVDIPYFWLIKFAKGEMNNPSVNRIQSLYEHLTGHNLLETPSC